MGIHRTGGTVIMMERFDPEEALRIIDTYGVQCGQFVPTHFVRMLKLPEDVRTKYNISTLVSVVHSAASVSFDAPLDAATKSADLR